LVEMLAQANGHLVLSETVGPGIMRIDDFSDFGTVYAVIGNNEIDRGIILGRDDAQNIREVFQPFINRQTDADHGKCARWFGFKNVLRHDLTCSIPGGAPEQTRRFERGGGGLNSFKANTSPVGNREQIPFTVRQIQHPK
jgi:hypothetical protein